MTIQTRKIINDPVYGFITIDHPLLLKIVAHPYYQRLRRIHQMAFAHLVYPGAVHTRLHHSLGAYHLMGNAVVELRRKGVVISEEEELGVKVAILLHDAGHGPFSHALEMTCCFDCYTIKYYPSDTLFSNTWCVLRLRWSCASLAAFIKATKRGCGFSTVLLYSG